MESDKINRLGKRKVSESVHCPMSDALKDSDQSSPSPSRPRQFLKLDMAETLGGPSHSSLPQPRSPPALDYYHQQSSQSVSLLPLSQCEKPKPTQLEAVDDMRFSMRMMGTDGDGDGDGVYGEISQEVCDGILYKAFSFLDDTTLCEAAMVCKTWLSWSSSEEFWKVLSFEGRPVKRSQVKLFCRRYPNATTLNLRGAPCGDGKLVLQSLRYLRNLQVLHFSPTYLGDGFFPALAQECSSLQSLSISDASFGRRQRITLLHHPSLRELNLYTCKVFSIEIRCPQLDLLSLKQTQTNLVNLICPQLVTLDMSSCHALSDAFVRDAVTACPLLTSLDISNCGTVSDFTLSAIFVACTSLQILDASYCHNISLQGLRFPNLIKLKLQGCRAISSLSLATISTCTMLEELALDFCPFLTAITLDLPRLCQISLTNSRVSELTLQSPVLIKLNLANCHTLDRVDITSSALQILVLRKHNRISRMVLQCSSLRELDLSECISINYLKLECPLLQRLHLDGCLTLKEASFSPVGLVSLDLKNISQVTKLEVEASQMTRLDLKGCSALIEAVIVCPALLSLDASLCTNLDDDFLDSTASSCPLIQSMVLHSCLSVGPVGLLSLKQLKHLTTLDVSNTHLTDLSSIFEACRGLKVLTLQSCKNLGDKSLDALHGGQVLPSLRELDLSYGSLGKTAIEGMMNFCPRLSHVNLSGSIHVTDLLLAKIFSPPVAIAEFSSQDVISTENTRTVESLLSSKEDSCQMSPMEQGKDTSISGFSSFSGSFDERGKQAEIDLTKDMFELANSTAEFDTTTKVPASFEGKAFSMDVNVGYARALQNLSCVRCLHLEKVVIPNSEACLKLSSLNLSSSVNIREVSLSCANLTFLDLSKCASLVELQLKCPLLTHLLLQACGIEATILQKAMTGCPNLKTLDVRRSLKVSYAEVARMKLVRPRLKILYSGAIGSEVHEF